MYCNSAKKIKKTPFIYLTTIALMVLTTLAPLAVKASETPENLTAKVDAFVAKLQNRLNVLPGISVSIVKEQDVVLLKGYGVADISTNTPITPHTYSYIASGTKAFLGLTVASLVSQGEIDLDAPLGTTYLSDMDQVKLGRFGKTTFRKLLTHTHGFNGDAIGFRTAYTGDVTSEIVWDLLMTISPAEKGEIFQYSNFGYVASSYVLEHIYKENWQTLVARSVLVPAGMVETVFKVSDLLNKPVAMPHQWRGTTQKIPLYKRDSTMHAAGGQFTTGADMVKWLKLNLNEGKIDGRQVVPAAAVRLIQAPLVSLDAKFYEFKRETHGLGWYDADYEGERLLHHFGAFSGYRAHISMMPKLGLGISILSNDMSPPTMNMPDMIAAYVYDLYLGKENPEAKYEAQIAEMEKRMAPMVGRNMPKRPRNAPDGEKAYAGLYKNDQWGVWELRNHPTVSGEGELKLHWGSSVSEVVWVTRNDTKYIRFEVAGNGYLAKPNFGPSGSLDCFTFRGVEFTKG